MTDASWDNSGAPPAKKGMGTGVKVLLGCGGFLLLLLVTCVVGGGVLAHMVRKDPKGFERRIEGWAKQHLQGDWDRLRAVVEQLQTDDGARALYRANPDLKEDFAKEELLLAAARGWRARLAPLPLEVPLDLHRHRRHEADGAEAKDGDASTAAAGKAPEADPAPGATGSFTVDVHKEFGTTTVRCRYPNGTWIIARFDASRVTQLRVE